MTQTVTPGPQPAEFDAEWVRAKYAQERDKRLRPEAVDQYVEVTADFSHYADDPYTEQVDRDPVHDHVGVAIIGAGLGSIVAAARLTEAGIGDIRVIDTAGDFGGTWYWNRYPGVQCDIESYIYLPLLEELNYVPTERYAHGREIREHLQAAARHYRLYDNALLQTTVTGMRWDEERRLWEITTDRGDAFTATLVAVSPGSLTRPKLPGIAGINEFAGHTFHTSRWDYGYTGGDETGHLERLADKRVGIIGTGATGLQCVPHLGEWAEQLYVFQRTPSTVGERGNRPTDPAWAASLKPGWQRERMENFTRVTCGVEMITDLVDDGWTRNALSLNDPAVARETARLGREMTPEEIAEFLFRTDWEVTQRLRARIDATVDDPATAESLKAWYRLNCKRTGFHDQYLETFNRPNVTLVDTDGRGVARFTENAVVVDGVEYEIDALIFATGFEVGTEFTRRLGFEIIGRDGVRLSDKWAKGMRTLHGLQTHGFPNCFFLGYTQSGVSPNYTHTAEERARHFAYLVSTFFQRDATTIEATAEAEDAWLAAMNEAGEKAKAFYADCTPSYLSSEGDKDNPHGMLATNFGGKPVEFFDMLASWRAAGTCEGVRIE
ncbi:monooxygenase [Mycolicibacterium insubricum]|uniref:Monooxygenase n=1 Tax=Mycolicibacterium insubricum TaxID=444597 RepID=A0A1X0DG12_9MYCO|nr:NAD(P)/FAD-dependent oxidoreductase [Mycolicibacterium insubricum]MCV7080167.1 NAD(P)/FAD-dependent oxidoreductase [Mycolicibacterium insubricum]ORA71315.1 monooxygenase [Mycolicibacterium insubricum]BBZ68078.1 monooxygenase [Mycolicibacterium insubricum]